MGDQQNDPTGTPESGGAPTPTMGDLFWVGTACAISVVAGLGLGYLLDQWANTTPWLTFAGLAFGIVSAVLLAVRQLRRLV
ncbi:MAG TPA: AtpZ/AtpI family protein [Acidimicrobiales bacterium]|nr:AtpZ/AtpI family protein [Acidimicrobiales bacterium]